MNAVAANDDWLRKRDRAPKLSFAKPIPFFCPSVMPSEVELRGNARLHTPPLFTIPSTTSGKPRPHR